MEKYKVTRIASIKSPLDEIILPVDKILILTAEQVELLCGKVQQIAIAESDLSTEIHSQSFIVQERCVAIKVGGRICGAPLKERINGFLSCSDMACQVPATSHGLVPRKQREAESKIN